ncbi:substrate-binding domain-containing protein [Cesiribacter andamanensis]|uniref:ABC-type taurine transport system, periplasmic component n=1 Tax=Cesiribacter andamanensis AMV16 TaxID=1279009 RepID=M7N6V4_9BACT|nr:substrate-binding domain-containing protein [Cesiribacter andamanensis]EMR03012.1 ABC-type taurine transport system, periplasmic component [Cesiribacter andamanensis AMV16]
MKNPIDLRIGGVPEHFNLPWQIALEENAFSELPATIQWTDYAGGTGAMAADLREGKLDVAMLLTEGAVADIIRGSNYRIVSLYVDSPLLWGIHVHADSPFQEIQDLKGCTYAVSRYGSGSHLMAFVDAKSREWPTKNLKFETVGTLEGAREALANKTADAFLWEKFMTKPLVDSGEWRRIEERPTPWPCFVVVVREEIMDQHAELVSGVLQVVRRYGQQLKFDPEAPTLIARRYGLKPEDAKTWWDDVRWANNSIVPVLMLEEVMNTLMRINLIPEKVLPEKLCYEAALLV